MDDHINLVSNQYIVTGDVVEQAQNAIDGLYADWPTVAPVFLKDPEMAEHELIETFESEHLGVAPGFTWRESEAGFSGGYYPVDAIAGLAGLTSEQYTEYIAQTKPRRGSKHLIRSADYLVKVPSTVPERAIEKRAVSDIYRLSKIGLAVLESTLSAYEAGKKEAQR